MQKLLSSSHIDVVMFYTQLTTCRNYYRRVILTLWCFTPNSPHAETIIVESYWHCDVLDPTHYMQKLLSSSHIDVVMFYTQLTTCTNYYRRVILTLWCFTPNSPHAETIIVESYWRCDVLDPTHYMQKLLSSSHIDVVMFYTQLTTRRNYYRRVILTLWCFTPNSPHAETIIVESYWGEVCKQKLFT